MRTCSGGQYMCVYMAVHDWKTEILGMYLGMHVEFLAHEGVDLV